VRHVRMLGLCLVAALALGAYAVSSASALEWGKCELAGPGHNYTGPNCTKSEKAKPKGTGEYEWRKASEVAEKRVAEGKSAGVPFTGHSVGSGGVLKAALRHCADEKLDEEQGAKLRGTRQECAEKGWTEGYTVNIETPAIECEHETNAGGHTEGKNKVAGVTVTFTGCLYLEFLPCESAGAEPGEIVTSQLKGKLGWINKSTKEVGVVLEPESKHGLFAHFNCSTLNFEVGVGNKKEGTSYVKGTNYPAGCQGPACLGATPEEEKHGGYDQVISPITPVNQMTGEFTQVYATHGEEPFGNVPSQFEGKHISMLEVALENEANAIETQAWSTASEEITNVNVTEEEGEIKA
jgi:hypothetical protein